MTKPSLLALSLITLSSWTGAQDGVAADRARAIAHKVRMPGCATTARGLVFNEVEGLADPDQAEQLVAAMRECASVEEAAALLRAAVELHASATGGSAFPARLSGTGFFASTADGRMAEGFVPYQINAPMWSDGARKHRFFRVPPGEAIGFRAGRAWDFPRGTTFLQTLFFETEGEQRRTETRVIVKGRRGLRFASYVWNEEGNDAKLAPEGEDFYVNHGNESQLWKVAPRAQCSKCHNEAAGFILSLTTLQMNRRSGDANQLESLAEKGILRGVPAKQELAALPALAHPFDAGQPLEHRARSYLHVNCSNCHRPGGPGSGTLDLRITTPLARTGTVQPREEGNRRMVVPGNPRASELMARMGSVGWDRMPSMLSTVQDQRALALIGEWIRQGEPSRSTSEGACDACAGASPAACDPGCSTQCGRGDKEDKE